MRRKHKESIGRLQQAAHVKPPKNASLNRASKHLTVGNKDLQYT